MLGILLRFKRGQVAVAGYIEQMFYCFEVDKSDSSGINTMIQISH